MSWLLEAGPFSAADGEGRALFDTVGVRLQESRCTVLDGSSGSGKSTLLRQIAGLETACDAHRVVSGEAFPRQALTGWRARVTLLAQDAPMLPGTVEHNLRFPFRQAAGRDRRLSETRIGELLDAVGLAGIALDRDAATLSGGERHRLALVRGLLWDPTVLVADEPLGGLDPDAAAECFTLLLEQARRPGRAVLCVLHHRALAGLADARLRLADAVLEASS